MKVLQRSEHFLKLCGLFSDRSNESSNSFFKSINTFVIFVGLFALSAPCAAYVYQNHTNLSESINAFVPLIAGSYVVLVFISLSVNMKTMKHLHHTLQAIVDNGKTYGQPQFNFFNRSFDYFQRKSNTNWEFTKMSSKSVDVLRLFWWSSEWFRVQSVFLCQLLCFRLSQCLWEIMMRPRGFFLRNT